MPIRKNQLENSITNWNERSKALIKKWSASRSSNTCIHRMTPSSQPSPPMKRINESRISKVWLIPGRQPQLKSKVLLEREAALTLSMNHWLTTSPQLPSWAQRKAKTGSSTILAEWITPCCYSSRKTCSITKTCTLSESTTSSTRSSSKTRIFRRRSGCRTRCLTTWTTSWTAIRTKWCG